MSDGSEFQVCGAATEDPDKLVAAVEKFPSIKNFESMCYCVVED